MDTIGTTTSALRDLPPHIRLLAWPALNRRDSLPGVAVAVPDHLAACPASLACYSRAVTVGLDLPPDVAGTPEAVFRRGDYIHPLLEPLRLVVVLALWDEVVRAEGVYAGNIYLASEGSVAALMEVALGSAPPAPALDELLEQLHAMEMLYRFPVAYKFRGAHGRERQCRINGWGRLLFHELTGTDDDVIGYRDMRTRLTEHITQHRDAYTRGVARAVAAHDDAGGRVWQTIHEDQPIPVLI